jgi:hypothetical protein
MEILLLIVLKVKEYGNQSLKERIPSRIFDDRKSFGPQILNLTQVPKILCAALPIA